MVGEGLATVKLKLWKVTITRSYLVSTPDSEDAETHAASIAIAEEHESEDCEPPNIAIQAIMAIGELEADWQDGIPYGHGEQTCREILA